MASRNGRVRRRRPGGQIGREELDLPAERRAMLDRGRAHLADDGRQRAALLGLVAVRRRQVALEDDLHAIRYTHI